MEEEPEQANKGDVDWWMSRHSYHDGNTAGRGDANYAIHRDNLRACWGDDATCVLEDNPADEDYWTHADSGAGYGSAEAYDAEEGEGAVDPYLADPY